MLWTFVACPYTSNFIYFKSEISLCLNKTFGIWMTNTFKTSTYMHWNHLTFRVKTKPTSSNMSKSSSLYFFFIQKVHIYKRTHAIKNMNKRNVLFYTVYINYSYFSKIKKHMKTEQTSKQTNTHRKIHGLISSDTCYISS